MKRLLLVLSLVVAVASSSLAWDTRLNPDVAPSIGWGVHGGRLPGILEDNARYTEFGMDFRAPITNYLSLTIDYTQTTVSDAPLGVPTGSNRVGASFRVYLRDMGLGGN